MPSLSLCSSITGSRMPYPWQTDIWNTHKVVIHKCLYIYIDLQQEHGYPLVQQHWQLTRISKLSTPWWYNGSSCSILWWKTFVHMFYKLTLAVWLLLVLLSLLREVGILPLVLEAHHALLHVLSTCLHIPVHPLLLLLLLLLLHSHHVAICGSHTKHCSRK